MTWGEFLTTHAWHFAIMALLLVASGFFSGTETALFSLTRGQIHRLRQSRPAGRLVASLMRRPRQVLNTLLLSNMLVNVAFTGISAVMILDMKQAHLLSMWQAGLVSLVPLLALILIGEVTPKMLAFVLAESWAVLTAGLLIVVRRILWPVLAVLDVLMVLPITRLLAPRPEAGAAITAEELGALLDLSAKRGIIDHDAGEMLQEIAELDDLRVSDIMVPRVDLVAYNIAAPNEGLVGLFRKTRLRRIPVYAGDIDNILGVVHAKRLLLAPATPLGELVVKVPFVPAAGSVERTLLQLRVAKSQLAIVVDEYGGTAGLVTLEDILEEIVGDIPSPHDVDRGPAVVQTSETEYLLDGGLAIHEWSDAFKMDLTSGRISTIGGFVISLLGRIPREGETAAYRNLTFTVESVRRRRIGRIRLRRLEDSQ